MKLSLQNQDLWKTFKEHQNEMIVTNKGRRLYPVISVSFEDLHPRHFYVVMVDFVSVDNFKYRFEVKSNSWVTAKKKTDLGCPRMYTHPETPASGASLMMNGLTFQKLKLTNSLKLSLKDTKMIPLKTMCRYIPRIHVVESAGGIYFDWRSKREFPFPEGEFTAVSHYQNKQIAQLKIDGNPFASAFRSEGLHGKAKRSRRSECVSLSGEDRTGDGTWIQPNPSSPEAECSTNTEEQNSGACVILSRRVPKEPENVESCPSGSSNQLPRASGSSSIQANTPETTSRGSWTQIFNENASVNQLIQDDVLLRGKDVVTHCDESVTKDEMIDKHNAHASTRTQGIDTIKGFASNSAIKSKRNRRKSYHPRRIQKIGSWASTPLNYLSS